MEPKNYSTIRSILKKAQGEKKWYPNTPGISRYRKITYEIYQEERKIINHKRTLPPSYDKPRKKWKLEA